MSLITVEGGRDSNSYVTLSEMSTYLSEVYSDTMVDEWLDRETAAQEHCLKIAVLLIDELSFRGCKACRDQRLQFPRWSQTDDNYPTYEDQYIDMSDIPNYSTPLSPGATCKYGEPPSITVEVKKAQMEMAFRVVHGHLLREDAELFDYPEHEVRSFTLGGGMTIDFFSRMGRDSSAWDKAKFTSTSITEAYLSRWIQHFQGAIV